MAGAPPKANHLRLIWFLAAEAKTEEDRTEPTAHSEPLLLGIDGGGTTCRARLATFAGEVIGEATTGPANLRLGIRQSFAAVTGATLLCLKRAGLTRFHLPRIVACLALAGASEPAQLAAAEATRHSFGKAVITTDAHAACIGAHGERDGGIVVVGTGSVGWAIVKNQSYRVGGWGLPLSDEGSGAWLGGEALRRVLWARDGRIAWTPLLRALFVDFNNDPHAIVRWGQLATPRDLGAFAPHIFEFASRGDPTAVELMQAAAFHVDALAARLIALGADRIALVGGCAKFVKQWLGESTTSHLVEPLGDALQGALHIARSAARPHAQVA
jgi:glucosamine kinase